MKMEIKYFRSTDIFHILGLALLMGCADNQHQFDGTGSFIGTEVVVSAEVAGRLITLDIEEGQKLTKDEVVGLVDTNLLHLQKNQIQAQIRSMWQGIPNVQAQTQYFDQQIELARIKLSHLEKEQERVRNLLKVEAATQKQLDDIDAQVSQAAQQIEVLIHQKSAQTSALVTQKAGLEAKPIPLQAQLDVINEQIRRAWIVNPGQGTVLATYAEPGEYTSPGKPLYRIANLQDMYLKAYIPGNQYTGLKLHQKVTVLTDDGNGGFHKDSGTITWISDVAEFTPKTIQTREERENLVYAIKIAVNNTDDRYKIGMYGEVKF